MLSFGGNSPSSIQAQGANGPRCRPRHPVGFTLIELLAAVAIVVALLLLTAAAFYNARASQAKQATLALIVKIDDVISRHFASYAERRVPEATSSADRSLRLRRLASAELPDSWADVRFLKERWAEDDEAARQLEEAYGEEPAPLPAAGFDVPRTSAQEVYVSLIETVHPTDEYGDAECLFMIVMQSGLADCLSCVTLGAGEIDDCDDDGAPEFVDAWGQPIRYVLWPAAFEFPPDTERYFSTTPPFSMVTATPAPGGVMRPLIFSRGSDETGSIVLNTWGNLSLGDACGDPQPVDPTNLAGGRDDDPEDGRMDNITNLDGEVKP